MDPWVRRRCGWGVRVGGHSPSPHEVREPSVLLPAGSCSCLPRSLQPPDPRRSHRPAGHGRAHRSADRDTESHHPDPETGQPPAQPPSCGNKLGRARSGSCPAGRGSPAGVRPLAVWASAVDSWLARGLQGTAIRRGCRESGLGLSDGTGVLLPRAQMCPGHLRERWDSGCCRTRECGPVNVLPSAVAPGQGGGVPPPPCGPSVGLGVTRRLAVPRGGPGIPSRAALRRTTPGAARAALEPKHCRAPCLPGRAARGHTCPRPRLEPRGARGRRAAPGPAAFENVPRGPHPLRGRPPLPLPRSAAWRVAPARATVPAARGAPAGPAGGPPAPCVCEALASVRPAPSPRASMGPPGAGHGTLHPQQTPPASLRENPASSPRRLFISRVIYKSMIHLTMLARCRNSAD